MIPTFYRHYKQCMDKVVNDQFIKERLLDFSFDNCSLVLCMDTYHKANKAEKALNLEIAKSNPARRRYEQAMKKAYYSFTKHMDFLNLAFSFNAKVRIALGLLDQADLKSPEQWYIFALSVYRKVLVDTSIHEQLFAFNITVDQLRKGRIDVQIAQETYNKLTTEIPGAKKLLDNRDGLVLELQHIIFELEIICIYALADNPGLIAELGLPIMHAIKPPIRPKTIPATLKKVKIMFKKELREAAEHSQVTNA
ncbi:MAG: hypothetical protein QG657_4260 [Acidobacteriota bacterium]|nr:hypothetical protein [Acidobacteriota bacterium]